MNWFELKPGDSLVAERPNGASYTLLRIEPSSQPRRMKVLLLDLETNTFHEEDLGDGPIHFFTVFKAEDR